MVARPRGLRPGRASDPNRDVVRLRSVGVGYVLVNGDVADRVLRARDRYPRESRFYDELRTSARRVYGLEPGSRLSGPWIRVYHLRT